MKSGRSSLKKAVKDIQKNVPLVDMATPALAPGPSKVSRAQIRKAVLAAVKARTAKTGATKK